MNNYVQAVLGKECPYFGSPCQKECLFYNKLFNPEKELALEEMYICTKQTKKIKSLSNKAYRFQKLQEQDYEIFVAKNNDYGDSTKAVQDVLGPISHLPRMMDKIIRVNNLLATDTKLSVNESIKDSLMDLANYALIMILDLDLDLDKE